MNVSTRKLAAAAIVGGAYAALTMLLAPISYGAVQFRVSEALCVLPAILPCTAWGLFAGCAAANLISAAGPLDVIFGSLATLGAALCAAAIGRGRMPAAEPAVAAGDEPLSLWRAMAVCLMPALWNGPIIGGVIAWVSVPGEIFWQSAALFGAQVAAGELGVMLLMGLPLLRLLPKSRAFMDLVDKFSA